MFRGNGFDKDPERARAAGRKSRRPLSLKARLKKYLEMELPPEWKEIIDKGVNQFDKNGKVIGNLQIPKNYRDTADALTIRLIHEYISTGNPAIYKMLMEHFDGKPKEHVTLAGDEDSPIEYKTKLDKDTVNKIEETIMDGLRRSEK